MKKIINAPGAVISDYIEALTTLHPNLARVEGLPLVVRGQAVRKPQSKVALLSGGGSGHEPAHAGFVGTGMLDGAVLGPVFTSPSVDDIYAGIRAVATEAGVLLIVKNYTGDRLNFGLAAQMAQAEGIRVEMVVVADDCALGEESRAGRRGLTGTVLVHKLAGAAAERGCSLEQIVEAVHSFLPNIGTMGVAIGPCYTPGAIKPNFTLGPEEVEWGLGIHGEPGTERGKIVNSAETADRLVSTVLTDKGFSSGDRVVALANGLGGTPDLELQIFGADALSSMQEKGLSVERFWVGNFITSLETPGVSVTVAKVTAEQLELLSDECDVVAFPSVAPRAMAEAALVLPEQSDAQTTKTSHSLPVTPDFLAGITAICQSLVDSEEILTDMDREVGDGDMGTNLARGAREVINQLETLGAVDDQVQCLRTIAQIVRKEVGGTSGPLYSLFIMGLADVLSHSSQSSLETWSRAAQQGLSNIQTIGGAQPGDCTMVDALDPAVHAVVTGARAGVDSGQALEDAAAAAEIGAESTREILAGLGRSSYVGERAIGHRDPGAVAVAMQFRALQQKFS